jgi:hypothetical protein
MLHTNRRHLPILFPLRSTDVGFAARARLRRRSVSSVVRQMKPTSAHSFPDAEVTAWRLSTDRLEVEVSDVFFEGNSHGPAILMFPLDKPASAMSYDHISNQWTEEKTIEPLKDICEFHHKNERHYSLKGFGSESVKWLAVGVLSVDAKITW